MRVREDFYPEHYLDAVTPSPIQESGGLVKDYIYGCTGRRGATIPWPEEGAAVMGDPSAPGAGCDPPPSASPCKPGGMGCSRGAFGDVTGRSHLRVCSCLWEMGS